MNKPLQVLIVEDMPDDAELMVMRLEEEGFNPKWKRVQTEPDYLKALEEQPDLILSDWSLPQFSGLRALELMNERGLNIPFILVSGSIGEEAAIDALHQGACDYILKDRSKRLGQAVRRTLESRRYQHDKEHAEADLKRRLAELEVLYDISSSLRYLDNLDAILSSLLDRTLIALETAAGAIYLAKPVDGKLYQASAKGWLTQLKDEKDFQPGESIVGITYESGKPYTTPEFIRDPNIREQSRLKIPAGWGGVYLPIHSEQDIIGAMVIAVKLPREINLEEIKLLSSIAEMAGIAVHRIRLFEKLQTAGKALASAYDETIKGWANALELRDHETEGHSERVTELTVKMARHMGLSEEQIIHIYRGALLHDIGKMGVSDTILLKPGSLNEREWEIMYRHPFYAYEMLAPIAYLKPALNIPYCHHEKFDGSGYPQGLKGDTIPLEARIFAVIDVFDALTSDRPYRKAWSRKEALEYIKKVSGTHFDPQVVELFLDLIKEID
jgi:response regulator RpfG family c-di-GMP phosphodiesterase